MGNSTHAAPAAPEPRPLMRPVSPPGNVRQRASYGEAPRHHVTRPADGVPEPRRRASSRDERKPSPMICSSTTAAASATSAAPRSVHCRGVHRFGELPVISLADYSPTTLKFIKTNDLACVFVFAVEGGRPVTIGHALGLKYRFDQVQSQHPRQITIEHVAWTPSAATAALIVEDIAHRLAARAMHAGWYHVNVADAVGAVRKACRMFPSTRIVEHEALMLQLASHSRRAWA
jgi:hypothetical protein